MKKFTTAGLFITMLFFAAVNTSMAQSNNAVDMFKNHINSVVQKVEKANKPQEKRKILNQSFDKLLTSFNKVESMKVLSARIRRRLTSLQKILPRKKMSLTAQTALRG